MRSVAVSVDEKQAPITGDGRTADDAHRVVIENGATQHILQSQAAYTEPPYRCTSCAAIDGTLGPKFNGDKHIYGRVGSIVLRTQMIPNHQEMRLGWVGCAVRCNAKVFGYG